MAENRTGLLPYFGFYGGALLALAATATDMLKVTKDIPNTDDPLFFLGITLLGIAGGIIAKVNLNDVTGINKTPYHEENPISPHESK